MNDGCGRDRSSAAAPPPGTNQTLHTETNPLGEVDFEAKVALLDNLTVVGTAA